MEATEYTALSLQDESAVLEFKRVTIQKLHVGAPSEWNTANNLNILAVTSGEYPHVKVPIRGPQRGGILQRCYGLLEPRGFQQLVNFICCGLCEGKFHGAT